LLFVVPLVLGHEEHWPLWGWVMLAASVAVFAVFALLQRRAISPLVPGRVAGAPGMRASLATIFLQMATFGGFLFSLALHLQGDLGYSPLRAGLFFIPGAAGFALSSLNWRRAPAWAHRPMILLGLLVARLGYLGLAVFESGGVGLEVAMGVAGLGLGAAFSPLVAIALTHVAVEDAADAGGLLVMTNQLGQVVGVATFGTLFLSIAPPTGHALTVTSSVLAAVAALAAWCGVPLLRRRRA
jgi:predicted MFS family arabinose efflux permease